MNSDRHFGFSLKSPEGLWGCFAASILMFSTTRWIDKSSFPNPNSSSWLHGWEGLFNGRTQEKDFPKSAKELGFLFTPHVFFFQMRRNAIKVAPNPLSFEEVRIWSQTLWFGFISIKRSVICLDWKNKCKNSWVCILEAVGVLLSLMLISARDLGAQLTL